MRRSVINSTGVLKLKHKRHKILKRKIIVYFVVFAVFVTGLSLASRIHKLNINEVKIFGNTVVDTKSIQTIVEKKLNGYYFWIFPKTNFLIYPKRKILRELSDKYKRLKDVSLSIVNIKTLNVSVNEYEGKYLWCGNVASKTEMQSKENCYFMDSTGYIFDEAPFFSGEVYLQFYGSINNDSQNPLGLYFKQPIFSDLIRFKESIKKMDLKLSYVFINDKNDVYVNLSTLGIASVNPQIILKSDSNFEKMAENLKAAITTEPLQSKLKNNYAGFLYIDLRYGNKVYYKFST